MQHDIQVFTFVALVAAIIVQWVPRLSRAWPYLFSASLMSAALAGIVSAVGVLLIGAVIACLHVLARLDRASSPARLALQVVSVAAASVLALGVAIGWFPGFEKLVWYRDLRLTPDAAPFTLSLNYGKAAIGALILGMVVPMYRRRDDGSRRLWRPLFTAMVIIVALSWLSVTLGYTRLTPKWDALFWPWAAVNLLFVCVAEEAFFRGFLQNYFTRWLASTRHGEIIAWLTASFLFGVAHAGSGAQMMLLAGLAGLGYGWIYLQTRSLGATVLTHFSLNATHFLLLTYPRLA